VLATASGLISLALGLYVYLNSRQRLPNRLFCLMTIFIAWWAFGEAMTISAATLGGKIFWTKFQGIGEASLVPTYLLISLYFPRPKKILRERRKAVPVIAAICAPFVLTIIFLFTTKLVYSGYYLSRSSSGVSVQRTAFFYAVTAIAFAEVILASILYLRERRRSVSKAMRKGLLVMALAPAPMLLANVVQNLKLYPRLNTLQFSLLFVILIGYGILRYGIFIDIRAITKRLLTHAAVMALNLSLFTLLCVYYVFVLDLGRGISAYILFVLTGIPFMLAYHAEVEWASRITDRFFSSRELKEARLLQELSYSIRTVRNLKDLAERVVGEVRESLSLAACALMVKEDDLYRTIGYSFHPRTIASGLSGLVEAGALVRKWGNWFGLEDEEGIYSGYWELGEEILRGESKLSRVARGIMRIYRGQGELLELIWPQEEGSETISIPLEVGGEEVGLLWMVGRPVRFSLRELDFIVALSTQVAVSLKNSQLLQELLDKSARLQQLIHRATTAQEEERVRISRELHDGLVPYFMDIIFKLELLEDLVGEKAGGLLQEVKEKAREGFRDLRGVIADLRPSSLDVLGLEKSLATYLERFGLENGMEVEFNGWGNLSGLDPLVEVTAFRVAQETLSNVARHARASKIKLSLGGDDGRMEMVIEDNGVGFLEREVMKRVMSGECLGIRGMKERAELMQGELKIESRPGSGTRVKFAVPLVGR